MESIVSTFHIDWKIIIAQAVNFGVVFVVLYMFALKPLNKLMAERSEKISKGITDAKENAALLEKTKKDQEEILAKARMEGNKIFQDVKKEAEEKKSELLDGARLEVSLLIENGKKNLEAEKIKMVEEAKKEIVSVAMLATEKILKEKTDLDNIK